MKRHIKEVPASFDGMTKPGIVDAEVDGLFLKKTSFVIWVSLPLLNLFGAHLVFLDENTTKKLLFWLILCGFRPLKLCFIFANLQPPDHACNTVAMSG